MGRMSRKQGKFKIGGEGNIDDNIKRLERELKAFSKSAPDIKIKGDSFSDEEEDRIGYKKLPSVENPEEKREKTQKRYKPDYPYRERKKRSSGLFALFKNTKFYIVVFGAAAFVFILIKTPVFMYTTPFRPDVDLPQIEVGFRYYNNIFGVQTRAKTVINLDKEKIVVPISMSRWMNTGRDKKLYILKYYRKK
ncbi:MAG: hypothetical protein JW957_05165 [Candidatus Omnitrophica bacterium]|nr:hypothetical protein [Candidatus Omnitrophota bacterium]